MQSHYYLHNRPHQNSTSGAPSSAGISSIPVMYNYNPYPNRTYTATQPGGDHDASYPQIAQPPPSSCGATSSATSGGVYLQPRGAALRSANSQKLATPPGEVIGLPTDNDFPGGNKRDHDAYWRMHNEKFFGHMAEYQSLSWEEKAKYRRDFNRPPPTP